MTDLSPSVGRRYRVGITSVLRRCAVGGVLGICSSPAMRKLVCLIVALLGISTAIAQAEERPLERVFVLALENCVQFYETHDFSVFDDWETVKPLTRSCDNCSTLSGKVKDMASGFSIDVELTDRGDNIGMGCKPSRGTLGPSNEDASMIAVNGWVEELVGAGRLQIIPENARRFPNEALKSCFRKKRPLAVLIAPRQSEVIFEMASGKPTGWNDVIPECKES